MTSPENQIIHQAFMQYSPTERTKAIFEFENFLLSIPKEQRENLNIKHYFADGLYAREVFVPKGTILTGAIHTTRHLCTVSQGDITIWSVDGVKQIKAPLTFISEPGTKRMGFANADTVWTTFHATEETDPEVIMKKITHNDLEELLKKDIGRNKLCQP